MIEKNESMKISLHKNNKGKSKEIVGDYLIKNIIGEGTFSKVKLGVNIITGQKVAIKILDKLKLIEEEGIERVLREIKISSELNHPNIIKIYKIIEEEKKYLVIMEYCEEGELFNYIVKKDRLSENESAFFYYQLINAIEYLHSKGIAHRDLKPENILLGENHIIKIIDFGLSNYFDEDKLLITPCGSPCYASPEMIRGEEYNGADNDIWATGIILFAMLCGYLPFENEEDEKNNNLLFKKILSGKLEYPSHLSNTALDLLKKILVNSPKKRIKIKEIKKHNFYLKGKKIFEKKIDSKPLDELKIFNNISDNFHNNNNDSDNYLTDNNKENYKDKYLNHFFKKNKKDINNYKDINIFKKQNSNNTKQKMLTTFKNKNNINLISTNNKLKQFIKNHYLATESNNDKLNLNTDDLFPLNAKFIDSLNKRNNLKQTFNYNNNELFDNNLLEYNSKYKNEKELIKQLKSLLPYNNKNLLFNLHQKKEKSMDYPHKNNKLYINNNSLNSLNTDLNFKSPNKRPLIQIKIYSSGKRNKKENIYDSDALYTQLNYDKPTIKMNDKLIINFKNDEEKNKPLVRINKKIQNLEKKFNFNSSFKNFNTRLNTDFKTNDNFPFINNTRNAILSPKNDRINDSQRNRKFYFNNFNNILNLKNKDYLNILFNSKNNYHSPNSVKI